MNKNVKRAIVLAAVPATIVAGASFSIAAWQVSGINPDYAGNGKGYQPVPLTVTATGVTQEAYPTGSHTQTVTVTNGNKFPVQLDRVSLTLRSSQSLCDSALNTQAGQASVTVSDLGTLARLAPSTGSQSFTPTVSFSNDFPQACAGAALNFTWTAVGSSAASV